MHKKIAPSPFTLSWIKALSTDGQGDALKGEKAARGAAIEIKSGQ
ncbi:hypothetical protein [Candidatus Regiella endosymbiont of Tuberolachnus salignus]